MGAICSTGSDHDDNAHKPPVCPIQFLPIPKPTFNLFYEIQATDEQDDIALLTPFRVEYYDDSIVKVVLVNCFHHWLPNELDVFCTFYKTKLQDPIFLDREDPSPRHSKNNTSTHSSFRKAKNNSRTKSTTSASATPSVTSTSTTRISEMYDLRDLDIIRNEQYERHFTQLNLQEFFNVASEVLDVQKINIEIIKQYLFHFTHFSRFDVHDLMPVLSLDAIVLPLSDSEDGYGKTFVSKLISKILNSEWRRTELIGTYSHSEKNGYHVGKVTLKELCINIQMGTVESYGEFMLEPLSIKAQWIIPFVVQITTHTEVSYILPLNFEEKVYLEKSEESKVIAIIRELVPENIMALYSKNIILEVITNSQWRASEIFGVRESKPYKLHDLELQTVQTVATASIISWTLSIPPQHQSLVPLDEDKILLFNSVYMNGTAPPSLEFGVKIFQIEQNEKGENSFIFVNKFHIYSKPYNEGFFLKNVTTSQKLFLLETTPYVRVLGRAMRVDLFSIIAANVPRLLRPLPYHCNTVFKIKWNEGSQNFCIMPNSLIIQWYTDILQERKQVQWSSPEELQKFEKRVAKSLIFSRDTLFSIQIRYSWIRYIAPSTFQLQRSSISNFHEQGHVQDTEDTIRQNVMSSNGELPFSCGSPLFVNDSCIQLHFGCQMTIGDYVVEFRSEENIPSESQNKETKKRLSALRCRKYETNSLNLISPRSAVPITFSLQYLLQAMGIAIIYPLIQSKELKNSLASLLRCKITLSDHSYLNFQNMQVRIRGRFISNIAGIVPTKKFYLAYSINMKRKRLEQVYLELNGEAIPVAYTDFEWRKEVWYSKSQMSPDILIVTHG